MDAAPAKIQPWKAHWLAMGKDTSPTPNGTRHGFAEGQVIIMDGNINGNFLDIITQKPVEKSSREGMELVRYKCRVE